MKLRKNGRIIASIIQEIYLFLQTVNCKTHYKKIPRAIRNENLYYPIQLTLKPYSAIHISAEYLKLHP